MLKLLLISLMLPCMAMARARHGDEDRRQDHCAADKPCADAVARQRCCGGHRGRRGRGQMMESRNGEPNYG